MNPQIAARGTCYFQSYGWAVVYYMQYQPKDTEGYRVACRREVKRKIEEGEIKIGKPPVMAGCVRRLIDGRYHYNRIRSITIQGRRWMCSNGNTYHTARVLLNGIDVYQSPITYGYEWEFETTGLEWLRACRHLFETDPVETRSELTGMYHYTCESAVWVKRRKHLTEWSDFTGDHLVDQGGAA